MGLVRRAAVYNSIINYLGIGLGYINIVLLFPIACSTDEFGLTRLLLSMAILHSQISNLGVNRTLVKFFPMLQTADHRHRGLLSLGFLIILVGFALISIPYIVFKPQIITQFGQDADMFAPKYYYVLPLALFHLFNLMLESFLQSLRKTVFTNFLKSFFVRVLTTFLLTLLIYDLIEFNQFLICFILSYFVSTLISIAYLIAVGHFKLTIDKGLFRPMLLKYMVTYSAFAAISGISAIVVNHIDRIMIGFFLGLTQTGVYSLAAYIGAVISVPAQSIGRVVFPIISMQYKRKDWLGMQQTYHTSALVQLILGGFIFTGIWINIDNIFALLPPDYSNGKWVIFWIGLSIIANIATGVNGQIINLSKYFQFDSMASLVLLVLTIMTNALFIPRFGINGAAFATFLALLTHNTLKFAFLYLKLNLNPFSSKTLVSLFILFVGIVLGLALPKLDNLLIDILYRSFLYTIAFGAMILFFKPSDDIQNSMQLAYKKLKKQFKSDS